MHRFHENLFTARQRRCLLMLTALAGLLGCAPPDPPDQEVQVRVERLLDRPIIAPASDPTIGNNIQGPSLIRVPDWVENPLGHYYLYFADHKGEYIRLAYADKLEGPWRIHQAGSLQLADSQFPVKPPAIPQGGREKVYEFYRAAGLDPAALPHDPMVDMTTPHIASPDVHVDHAQRRIVMYYHGLEKFAVQLSRVAYSSDGIRFTAAPELLGKSYMRVFQHGDSTYALAMPGQFYRHETATGEFQPGPLLFNKDMRHSAVLVRGDSLLVFWTQVGDAPERILLSRIDLAEPWMSWQATEGLEVLRPERSWEGAEAAIEPSMRSVAYTVVNQLRDPAIFEEDGRIYLLYAVGGESGIAIAEITFADHQEF